MALSGRSRKPQLAYAREHGLRHNPPAGGCLLTNEGPSQRYLTLLQRYPDFTYKDFRLIAYGRHFMLGDACRLVIARDNKENCILEKILSDDDLRFEPADITGPLGVLLGSVSESAMITAASFVARYCRARNETQVRIRMYRESGESTFITVRPADPVDCDACLF
jgi:hypothetical protein